MTEVDDAVRVTGRLFEEVLIRLGLDPGLERRLFAMLRNRTQG
jgi:hypothetical protein